MTYDKCKLTQLLVRVKTRVKEPAHAIHAIR